MRWKKTEARCAFTRLCRFQGLVYPTDYHRNPTLAVVSVAKLLPLNYSLGNSNRVDGNCKLDKLNNSTHNSQQYTVRSLRADIEAQSCLQKLKATVLRKQNKMSENEHESKVEMVISTVPKPVFTSVFWTFYPASVIKTVSYFDLTFTVFSTFPSQFST